MNVTHIEARDEGRKRGIKEGYNRKEGLYACLFVCLLQGILTEYVLSWWKGVRLCLEGVSFSAEVCVGLKESIAPCVWILVTCLLLLDLQTVEWV